MQMSVKDLRNAIKDLPDDLPVYFRRVAPICGNIEEAGSANLDTYSSFGVVDQCLIIEPMKDDDEDETEQSVQGTALCAFDHDMLALQGSTTCPECGSIPPRP